MDSPPRLRGILHVLLLLAALTGCDNAPSRSHFGDTEPESKPSLIAEADREHYFGPLIASSGRKIEHRYRLKNATQHDVRVLNIVNRKTCCGIVRAEARVLHPGEATHVEVTLIVGGRFGPVVHETEVVTDLPDEPSLVLRTMAQAVPPVRVEEDSAFERTILMGAREPGQAAIRVYASGTSSEPPTDLESLELRSTIKVEWAGPKETSVSDEGLHVESRRLIATLDPAGPPGERRAEILLQRDKQVVYQHVVSWEIASLLTASPKVIAMTAGQRDLRIVIRSRDQRPFRIKRIECTLAGIKVRVLSATAGLLQNLQAEGIPPTKDRRGAITVFTDHPVQEKVEVPFLVID